MVRSSDVRTRTRASEAAQPSAPSPQPFLLLTLCLTTSLSVLNALALSPFLAEIAPDLDTSVALLGQALMASSLVGASIGVFIGPSAEWLGYKRLLLAGIVALIACNVGTALAPSFAGMAAAQIVGGISAATISPMGFAIAGNSYEGDERRRVISRMFAAASVASIVGFPILTFIGSRASWRWSFVLLAVVAAAALALAAFVLERDRPAPSDPLRLRSVLGIYRPLLGYPPVTLVYAAQFLRGVAWTGMLTYIGAFLVDELDRSLQLAGLVWLVLGPGFLTGSLLVSGRLRRYDPRLTFMLTVTLMGAFIGVLFLLEPPIVLTFAVLLASAFAGGIAEVTAVTILSGESPAAQGATMALNSTVTRFGTAFGAFTGGVLLATGGYALLGVGFPIVALIAMAVCWRSRRPRTGAPTGTVGTLRPGVSTE